MRSILEKALIHLINEEKEQAEALFHKFIVERARQVHESLRNEDDDIVDDIDDIVADEMFTEEDLRGLEDDEENGVDGEEDEGAEEGAEDREEEVSADEEDDDLEDDAEKVAVDLDIDVEDASEEDDEDEDEISDPEAEERIARLEDQLEKLTQEFEELMAAEQAEEEADEEEEEEEDEEEDEEEEGELDTELSDEEAEEIADTVEDDMQDEVRESEEDLEDFDGLAESALSDLEKVNVENSDGKEVGKGRIIDRNTRSAVPGKKADPKNARPVAIKGETHVGFDREPAPPVKEMKKRRNVRSKATDGMKPVSKEGDKKALVNKPMC